MLEVAAVAVLHQVVLVKLAVVMAQQYLVMEQVLLQTLEAVEEEAQEEVTLVVLAHQAAAVLSLSNT
jgi:hypothetical protein